MRIIASPDGQVDYRDRANWLTPPFDLQWTSIRGYNIYRELVPGGAAELVDFIGANDADFSLATITHDLADLPANHTAWYYVKAVSSCGVEDIEAIRRVRIATDSEGNLILPEPDAPRGLQLAVGAGGSVTASWSYLQRKGLPVCATFNVYRSIDSESIDYDTPFAQVTATKARSFTVSLGTHADGTIVRCVVLPVTEGGSEGSKKNIVAMAVDASTPTQPSGVTFEVAA